MYTVILLMAGKGLRMKASMNKMMLNVGNKPLYSYALETFKSFNLPIILVVNKEDYSLLKDLEGVEVVIGGLTRSESVHNGLLKCKTDRVLIHDAARAFVSKDIINKCLNSKKEAFYVGIPLKDTIREKDTFKTLDRDNLISCQTPQGGNTKLFLDSYNSKSNYDDIEQVLKYTNDIELILGSESNFKITTQFDLELAKLYIGEKND